MNVIDNNFEQSPQAENQAHENQVNLMTDDIDELLFQVSGIRTLKGGKFMVTNEMVNKIREEEGI